ncbi:Serine/threonine-protein kinase RAD53 [Fusarium oxysporum f. sp. albedinis]|nr:Serine/threonine-protein kinase RAD53 [Fusarium oxysporum f. sp. albedinis]
MAQCEKDYIRFHVELPSQYISPTFLLVQQIHLSSETLGTSSKCGNSFSIVNSKGTQWADQFCKKQPLETQIQ